MRMMMVFVVGLYAVSLSAAEVRSELKDAVGKNIGSVKITETAQGLLLLGEFQNLPGPEHAVHIHSVGLCEGPKFSTAKGHWNPALRQHGLHNSKGAHKGDIPNLRVNAKGAARLTGFIGGVSLSDLRDTDGASIVIHAGPDDNMTDPAGNSGDRIACGVIN